MEKAPKFKLTESAKRGQYLVFADISEQTGASWDISLAVWEPQGYRTESAAKSFNYDRNDVVDVLDIPHSDISKGTATINFEPNPIRPGLRYGRFNEIIHEQVWREEVGKLANHKFMEVATYIEPVNGQYYAKVYDKCSVLPTDKGGDGGGNLGMSYEAAFAGKSIFGTVNKGLPDIDVELLPTHVVFTPEAA